MKRIVSHENLTNSQETLATQAQLELDQKSLKGGWSKCMLTLHSFVSRKSEMLIGQPIFSGMGKILQAPAQRSSTIVTGAKGSRCGFVSTEKGG